MILTPTEHQDHLAFVEWAHCHVICRRYLIHIENERSCTPAQGVMRKRKGVKAGVSDFFLAYPVQKYHGLWMEFKRKKGGVLSPKQLDWLALMSNVGYKTVVACGYDEAVNAVNAYLAPVGDLNIDPVPSYQL